MKKEDSKENLEDEEKGEKEDKASLDKEQPEEEEGKEEGEGEGEGDEKKMVEIPLESTEKEESEAKEEAEEEETKAEPTEIQFLSAEWEANWKATLYLDNIKQAIKYTDDKARAFLHLNPSADNHIDADRVSPNSPDPLVRRVPYEIFTEGSFAQPGKDFGDYL